MSGEKKKILVVDDSAFQLSLTKTLLGNEYDVIIAQSGIDALEKIRNGLFPDLILLDIIMPEMDGFQTYSKIRAISLIGDIPIIFVSSVTEAEEVEKATRLGAVDYVKKPLSKEALLDSVKNALNKNKEL